MVTSTTLDADVELVYHTPHVELPPMDKTEAILKLTLALIDFKSSLQEARDEFKYLSQAEREKIAHHLAKALLS